MRVIFPLQKEEFPSNKIVYPDNKSLFSNIEIQENNIIADYSGTKTFTKYVEPPKPEEAIITKYAFRKRFTLNEKVALKTSTDPVIQVMQDDIDAAQEIDLNDLDLIAGLEYCVTQGILTEERKEEILSI